MPVRTAIKNILVKLQLPVTRNLRYDIATTKILRRVLQHDSTGIDIGCHKGEILDEILKYAPAGPHFAFEPLPHLYQQLVTKYLGKNVLLSPVALYDQKGETEFQYVVNAPAYSGLRKRKYDFPDAKINTLKVETDLLDNIIPGNQRVDLIKIDVEGAEFGVLRGGVKTIQRTRPVIIFEFGIGAADCYGTEPETIFNFLTGLCRMSVSTLQGFLKKERPLDLLQFSDHFRNRTEYYFVAYNLR
jgi:FkbM family methyltransferase